MKIITPLMTVFFTLILTAAVMAAETSVSITQAVEENNVITVTGRVNNPVEGQRLIIMGCSLEEGDYNYYDDIYFNNIAADLNDNNEFTLNLQLGSHIQLYEGLAYVIRIGGSNIISPAVLTIDRSQTGGVVILGDVDLDGNVSSNDAALTLQYVLFPMDYITEDQVRAMQVTDFGWVTSEDAACIMMKTLDGAYEFPINRQ